MKKIYFAKLKAITPFIFALSFLQFPFTLTFSQTVVVTNPSSPWTVPAGVTSLKIEVWGGGGGGGAASKGLITGSGYGGGGGGGAYSFVNIGVTSGQNIVISIGGGGTSGNQSNGGLGGTTTVTRAAITLVSAPGGAGGSYGTGGGANGGVGGNSILDGGNGGNGTSNGAGGGGGSGNNTSGTNGSNTIAGIGGTGNPNVVPYIGGNGAIPQTTSNANGNDGNTPAGGGGGGKRTSSNGFGTGYQLGGKGASGQVVITYTLAIPTITNFTPSSGCANTTPVVITGTNFSGATAVQFGGTNAASFTINSATQITATPAAGTTGTITVITPAGNATSAANFTVNSLPTVTTPNIATACSGTGPNISLTASLASTFSWTVGTITGGITGATTGSGNTINQTLSNPSNSAAGTVKYIVTPTSTPGGCAGAPYTITVTVNPTPVITTLNTKSICNGSGTGISLLASAASSFTWTIGTITGGIAGASAGSGNTINQMLTNPSNSVAGSVQYIVTPISTTGSCPGVAYPITVTVNPTPVVTTSNTTTTCSGTGPNISLTASDPSNFAWTIGTITGGITGASNGAGNIINQTLTNPSNSVAGSVQYIVTPTSTVGSCPGAAYTITVTVNPLPAVTASNTAIICSGTSPNITLTSSTPSTFSWIIGTITGGITGASAGSGNTINQTLTNPSNSASGTLQYIVTPTSITGECPGAPYIITVTVNAPVIIATQPSLAQTVCATFPVSFTVVATGTGLTYQWYKKGTPDIALSNGGNISGATSTTLILAQAQLTDAGAYYVIVSGTTPCGSVPSNDAALIINQQIVITSQPMPQTVCAGTTATFTVGATGTGLMYQWRKGTTPLTNTGNISGATTAALIITNAAAGDAAANYNVVITTPFGICPQANSANVALVVNPIPNVTATPASQAICSGGTSSIVLTSTVPGATFSWTVVQSGVSGASNASGSTIAQALTATGNTPGTAVYTITPSKSGCDGAPIMVTIIVNPTPDVIATPGSQTLCSGDATSIGLTSNVGGTTFSWTVTQSGISGATASNGSAINQTLNATGTTPGTAVYTITPSANGCNGTVIVVTITVNPKPSVTATPASQNLCSGNSTNIVPGSNVAGATFSWTVVQTGVSGASNAGGASINQALTATGIAPGTAVYTITASKNGCDGAPVTVTITVNPRPVATATPVSQMICTGNATSIGLTSTVTGTTFSWTVTQSGVTGAANGNGTAIAQTLSTTGTAAGTATYTVVPAANGCNGLPITVIITVNPTVTISPLTQERCNGTNISTIAITGTVPGTITSWTRDNTGTVTGIPASGSGSISGILTNTTGSAVTVTFTINTTSNNGCSVTKTATVLVDADLTAGVASASQIVCTGSSPVPLTSTPPTGGSSLGYTYKWIQSDNPTGPWTQVAGATATIYTPPNVSKYYALVVYNACGTDTTNTVQISTAADFGASFTGATPSTPLCSGDNFDYTITSGDLLGSIFGSRYIRYTWQSQQPGYFTSPTVNPYGQSHTFFFIFTYYDGTANFTVTNNTNAPVTQNLVVTPTVYNSNGTAYCSLSPQIIPVTINPIPTVNAVSDITVCKGATVSSIVFAGNVTATGVSYAWTSSNPAVGLAATSGTNSTPTFTAANSTSAPISTTITVTPRFTNPAGGSGNPTCPGTAKTFTITVNPTPTVTATPSSQTICTGNTTSIALSSPVTGTTFSWGLGTVTGVTGATASSGSAIAQTLTATGTVPGTVVYRITPSFNGCVGPNVEVTVTVNPTATATLSAVQPTVCSNSGTNVTFTGTPNTVVTYKIGSGVNQTIALNAAGTAILSTGNLTANTTYNLVSVAYSTAPACSQPLTGSVTVTVNPVATAMISAGTSPICQGQSSTINFTGTPNTIVTYNDGSTNQTVTLSAAGVASVTVSPASTITYSLVSVEYAGTPNCLQALSGTITITVSPDANAGVVSGTSPLCIGATATFTSNGDAGGTWSSTNTAVAMVDAGGIVTTLSAGTSDITYTLNSGCNSPKASFKTVTVSPNATAGTITGGDNPICVATNIQLSATGDAGGIWSSDNTGVATVNASTGVVTGVSAGFATITYTVTSGCNAPSSASKMIEVQNVGAALNPGPITGPISVCASSSGFTYSVAPVTNASFYVWTVPAGWTITTPGPLYPNTITVTSGNAGGTISVQAGNACSISPGTSQINVIASPVGQWIGFTSDWNDGQNWCSGTPPDNTMNVTIPVVGPGYFYPIISTAVAMSHNLTIATGASLTVTGNSIQVSGNISNSGLFNVTAGAVEMNGSVAQNIGANTFMNNAIQDLIISNSSGVTLGGALNVFQSLTYGTANATFNSNGFLTLKSTISGTAWIGPLATTNTISGDVTVERYVASGVNHLKSWQLLAIPTQGQTVKQSWQEGCGFNLDCKPGYGTTVTSQQGTAMGFDMYSQQPSVKVFDYVSDTYLGIPNTGIPIFDKRGYFVFVRGDRSATTLSSQANPTVLRTKGTLFSPANPPQSTMVQAGKFESVGNPYAASIDLRNLGIGGATGISDVVIVWDPSIGSTQYGVGAFQTLFLSGGHYVNLLPSVDYGSAGSTHDYIQSGQAFFIQSALGNLSASTLALQKP